MRIVPLRGGGDYIGPESDTTAVMHQSESFDDRDLLAVRARTSTVLAVATPDVHIWPRQSSQDTSASDGGGMIARILDGRSIGHGRQAGFSYRRVEWNRF